MTTSMIRAISLVAILAGTVFSTAVLAEPIKLKLAFFSSDRASIYAATVKPFVDAINDDPEHLLEIDVYFSGALGKDPSLLPQMVLDGVADIAYIFPGYTEKQFPNNAVLELTGIFRDAHEAGWVYGRLVAANVLKGYDDFVMIGAYASEPGLFSTKRPVANLADLKGLRIRPVNATSVGALEKLGVVPVVIPLNGIAEAISDGRIDGSSTGPSMLFEFGVARVATHHYLLPTSVVPLALVMSRKKFDSLPEKARAVILKYSGDWTSVRYNEWSAHAAGEIIAKLKSDARRKVVIPSAADSERARAIYKSVIDEWAAKSPENRELLAKVEAEIASIRESR